MLIPSEMAPLEDRSQVIINISMPEGATFELSQDYNEEIAQMAADVVPEHEREGILNLTRGTWSFARVLLKPPSERERSQMEIARDLTAEARKKTRAMARVMQQSTFGGRRSGLPVQYVLQATSIDKLRNILPEFMEKVNENPAFQMADVNLKFTKPEIRIHLNREKAALMGVSTQNIGQTLQLALSGQRFGYFFMNGKAV
jgi:multidrug efflux pump